MDSCSQNSAAKPVIKKMLNRKHCVAVIDSNKEQEESDPRYRRNISSVKCSLKKVNHTANENEEIAAVSFYATAPDTEYKIYLVSHTHETGKDVYDEWITVKNGSTYSWEKIGNTDMTIDVAGIISDIADHTFTPDGTVSKPTFTGTKVTSTGAGGHSHTVTATGDVSSTFKGNKTTLSGTTTGHTHSISANGITVTASYQPAGTVTGSFSGTSATTSSVEAHTHKIEQGTLTSTGSYQPTGTITTPTFKGGVATIEPKLLNRCAVLEFFDAPSNGGVVTAIEGEDFLKTNPNILAYKLNFTIGDTIRPAVCDTARIGFYIAYANSRSELNNLMDEIKNTVKFII